MRMPASIIKWKFCEKNKKNSRTKNLYASAYNKKFKADFTVTIWMNHNK